MNNSFFTGKITVADSAVPVVSTSLAYRDILGAFRVRWGIRRESYKVNPGLYAAGNPGKDSDVFVTANYKLSFDALRKNLSGTDSWILVLDTKGVNVWCAAGKGTFGTVELVNRINEVSLEKVVSHRRLILPQLGATGVAAYKVKELTGFNVHFGPVRAADIKKFLNNGLRADKVMRKVSFRFKDRVKLIPNDFMYSKYYLLATMLGLFLISGLGSKGISYSDFHGRGGPALLSVFLSYCAGLVLTPMFLPYIPGRYFSLKGFLAGVFVYVVLVLTRIVSGNLVEIISWIFIITSISSFLAMNFTGSSTYTSLSGVKKEMKISIPFQIGFAATGLILQLIAKFI